MHLAYLNNLFLNLGCYGFFEEGKCLYVGQASNPLTSSIGRRIRDHYIACRNYTKTCDEIKIWFPIIKGPAVSDSQKDKIRKKKIRLREPTYFTTRSFR